jgi:hypothetical protein
VTSKRGVKSTRSLGENNGGIVNLLQKVTISVAAGAFEMVKTYKELREGGIEATTARIYLEEKGKESQPRKIGFIKR